MNYIMNAILLGWFGGNEIIVIVLIILLLFGGKKIPELMKGIGKGIREFRSGMNEKDENSGADKKP
jgi:sec-independent protein translocase protein TatA